MSKYDRELRECLFKMDLMEKQPCTSEEIEEIRKLKKEKKPLPDGIIEELYGMECIYYRWIKPEISQEEINNFLLLKRTVYLRTIKNVSIIFGVVCVISLFVFVISLSNL
ncbi:MAG: hypothetical protein A2Y15_06690 [Clostridiales bacterium GWF2_36_10]|nr:MAG: hypothetical protein A2Y15_06690 [Clostridiales bacterium GWF2_36_10]HAN21227.1 hypothetical protein [Clostridiales bacterium]